MYLNSRRRRTAFKNIKSVFPEKSAKDIHHISRRSLINMGISIIESLIIPRIMKNVEIKGKENITSPSGIFIGIHSGSWEVYNTAFAKIVPYVMMAKEQKNPSLNKILNQLHAEHGLKACFSLKELIAYLKKDYSAGLVIDHGAEDNALLVEFFSHLIPTPKGAVYMAKKFNKKIYPCFGYRKERFSHVIEIKPPINAEGKSEQEILRQLNKIYEQALREHPTEYLWYYKRFKKKRNLDVLILTDGKTGHLKQSNAFTSLLSEKDYILRVKTVEVKYKSQISRIFADIFALVIGRILTGTNWPLKLLLDKRTYQQLNRLYADIVVSAGSLVAPVNSIFSSYLGSRSVTILRPNIPLSKFDLSIIPEHDRIDSENTVKIKGALYYPDNINDKISKCKSFFSLTDGQKISVFFGGPIRDENEFRDNIKLFITNLKHFAQDKGYKILLSTSRRTPEEVENYIKKELGDFNNTEAAVYPRENNYDFVFDGFVSLSEIIFVTSESISMISEIASLGKACAPVVLERQDGKHSIFLQSMESETSLVTKPYDINQITPAKSSIFKQNKNAVEEKIGRLF